VRRWAISVIYLARHGETDWNQDKRIQGHTDVPLNVRGRLQAEALGGRLAAIPLDVIYASDLSRTRETAEIVAARQPAQIPVVMTPDLRECNYGLWEGLTREEVAIRYGKDWDNWNKNGLTESPTGGENFLSLSRRAGRAFDAAVQGGKTVLISTHRGTLRAVLCHALRLDPAGRDRFPVTNCSLSALEYRQGCPPRLIMLDDTSHLEAASPGTTSVTGETALPGKAGHPQAGRKG
jgi:broad specificity phosphatase PhoE